MLFMQKQPKCIDVSTLEHRYVIIQIFVSQTRNLLATHDAVENSQ